MIKKVKVGVIGTGKIGKLHLESLIHYNENALVVHVADPYMSDDMKQWLNNRGITKISADPYELINDPNVEAVLICSPTDLHSEHIIASAKANKHIFCEKPVDFDIERVLKTLKVVKDSKVKFQIGFNRRFDHNFKRVRDEVHSGKYGEPHIVKVTSRDPAPPPIGYLKASGGIFMDQMIHDFDMIRYLSGREVKSVFARGTVKIDPVIGELGDVDTALVSVEFDNGALGVIDNSRQAIYGYDQRVEVFCARGCCLAENDSDTRVAILTDKGIRTDNPPYFFLQRYFFAYVEEVKSFVKSIIENTEPVCSFLDGIMPVVIAEAAKRSLAENRAIETEEIISMERIKEFLN